MERYFSTGQSPQQAVAPTEEAEDVQADCCKKCEVLLHVSVFHNHHQGATVCALLKL
jgi:hypothetical protein